MLAVELAGGLEAGRKFVEGVQLAQLASTLGGPETLVTHPASSTHVGLTQEREAERGITDGLVRVSVGLEHPDDSARRLRAGPRRSRLTTCSPRPLFRGHQLQVPKLGRCLSYS